MVNSKKEKKHFQKDRFLNFLSLVDKLYSFYLNKLK